jgi:hypothetical protein
MLHKDYNSKGSVGKQKEIDGPESEGSYHQNELIGGKSPFV